MSSTVSPFDAGPRSRASRVRRALAAVVLLAVVAAAVVLGTRRSAPAAATAGHDHTAPAPAAGARPVRLSGEAARRIGVTFAAVTMDSMGREVRTVAQVTFDETRVATIAPRVDGWVEQLHVSSTGQRVRKGDPLFSMYSPMVVSAEEELVLAQRLARDVAGGSPEAVEGSRTMLEAARRRLQYWEVPATEIARLERSGEVRRTVTLRSPFDGVVVEKPVLSGQRIMAGDVVYRIADLSRVWLEGEVFEQDLASVRLGQQVTAELQALPGDDRTGRITFVYPTLNPETRTAKVRVELPNPGYRLKPGMYATIRFTSQGVPALSVPRSAVLVTGERALAFVKHPDGSFEPRDLRLGRTTDDAVEVLAGLAPGDTVVASATFLVDAESNLGSALGGMGDMPGMDIRPPRPNGDQAESHPAPDGR